MSDLRKDSAKKRILEASFRLFLKQGYSLTGLNQIVEEANTVKASLYQYYSSKEELGIDVLKNYSSARLNLLKNLMNKYPYPLDFVKAWVKILKREATNSELHGCGMANFRAQITDKEKLFLEEIKIIAKNTIQTIQDYLESAKNLKILTEDAKTKELANQLFFAYEGTLQGYRLLNEKKTLDELYSLSEQILKPNLNKNYKR